MQSQTNMTISDSIQPQAVAQDILDRTGLGLMTGAADLYLECYLLPLTISTYEGQSHVETRADLSSIFAATRAYLLRAGVTDLVRSCLDASFSGPDTIKATHESRYLSGHRQVQQPVVGFSVLKRVNGVWLVSDCQYAITGAARLSGALTLSTDTRLHAATRQSSQ